MTDTTSIRENAIHSSGRQNCLWHPDDGCAVEDVTVPMYGKTPGVVHRHTLRIHIGTDGSEVVYAAARADCGSGLRGRAYGNLAVGVEAVTCKRCGA